MTNPPLDQHFRRAHALRVEAAQQVTPEIRALVEAHISIQDRARGVGPMDALFFEKWRPVATGQAKLLLDQANDCYWRVVLQMDGYCRKKADIHHRRLMYDFEDLYQAARMGCWRAAVRFDPDRGYKFVSFADDWVRVACDRCRNQDHDLSVGNNQASTGNWGKGIATRLDAPILGLDEVRVIERVAAEEVETPDTMALARLRQIMDDLGLTAMERACLESVGDEDVTLVDIAKRFGKSRERARQVRNATLEKIKAAMLEMKETQKTKEDEMAKIRWPYYRKNPIVPGVCLVVGCDRTEDLTRGVCKSHHATLSRYGRLEGFALPPQTEIPSVLEIDDRGGDICLIKGCNNLPYAQGCCRKHYHHLRANNQLGILNRPSRGCAPRKAEEPKPITLVPPLSSAEVIDLPPSPLEVAENDVRGLSKILAETGLELQSSRAQLKDAQKNLEDYAQTLEAIDHALGLDPETTTEDARLTAIRGLRDQVAAQDNAIQSMRPVTPMSREEIMRRAELLTQANAIRESIQIGQPVLLHGGPSVQYGKVTVPLQEGLAGALRDHADALEAEALRGAA